MKQFILKIIIIAFPIIVLLLLTNYFGDAARLFDNDYEKQMAKIIINGQYVTNVENYDERLFQKELIISEEIYPNFVIVGSSRTMLINSDLFLSSSFLNNSVSGASIEDIISIYQLYKVNNKLPKKILLGVDPWLFNRNISGL
jgi:predicted glycosyltransferase involved in capsule biosynthesis